MWPHFNRRPLPHRESNAGERSVTSGVSENAELVERMRTDPVGTAPVVYARFAPVVNRVVWRLLGTDSEQNDVVQQVVCDILQEIASLREPEKVDSWVRSVAANTVYKLLRGRRVRRRYIRTSLSETHADLVRDIEARDLLVRIKAALEFLPAEERMTFVLHYVEERTLPEIAKLSGYSLATAKRKLRRANQHFQFLVVGESAVIAARPE
jgi:RNA polymerase sigma-70 factor, ECF subfamily